MPYLNLECDNEKTYRWHTVDDIKDPNNPILQDVIKNVKENISSILMKIRDIDPKLIADVMEKYAPSIIGIQTIHCEICKHLQVDVIVNDQTKIREDLWRSYEADRFVRQFMRGR
jgi:hypothetical protein